MTSTVRWVPAAALATLLFILSAQQELRLASDPALDTIVRKLGHMGAYGLLAIFVRYGLGGRPEDDRTLTAWALVVAYACSDELHQAFVPGRGPAFTDVVIDAVGALAGLVAWRLLGRRVGRRRRELTS